MAYRIAESLDQLRDQINALAPNRSTASDGWIGDDKHATRESDHNPWVKIGDLGIVTALDITDDPGHGCDVDKIFARIIKDRDPRLKYMIRNGMILSSTIVPWVWREYTGSNPHEKHGHLSVLPVRALFDSRKKWEIILPKPPVVKKVQFELHDDARKIAESLVVKAGDGELQRLQAFLERIDAGALKHLQDEGKVAEITIKRRIVSG